MSQSNEPPSFLSLWKQFIPLSLSDVTMAFGDPAITATLAQMPSARINLAAVGVAKSLAVFFESPIIMLLHASNALAGSKRSSEALWRFTILSVGFLTSALFLLVLPPVFKLIGGDALGVPVDVLGHARVVLLLLLLWPAAIAWRRYYQGLLIRSGHGNVIARASLFRLLFVVVVLGVGYLMQLPGTVLAGMALMGGVLTEAGAVTISAKRFQIIHSVKSETPHELPTTLAGIWRFYWPLANSMVVVWGGRAVLVAIVARAVDGEIALAIWPAAWGLVLLIANSTRMVQQVIIRNRDLVEARRLVYFALSVGAFASTGILLLGLTPLGQRGISVFVGFDAELFEGVLPVILVCSVVPMLVALQNAIQGFLVAAGKTQRINIATWLGTGVLLIGAGIGIRQSMPGASAAAMAMVCGLMVETAMLTMGMRGAQNSRVLRLNCLRGINFLRARSQTAGRSSS